ncbi:MAG: alanine--tRNA ligase, partial [Erysipelotrichaceae bacterium]|nr:alanine--tRNA ligase [Erysipelotrichaceae bacterium]
SVVAENMKEFYPYLLDKVRFVSTLVQKEEQAFHETLVNGEKLLQEAMKDAKNKCLSGEVVFKLYDTYGFPKELTVEIASDAGLSVDLKSFEDCMQRQKELSRSSRDVIESMSSQSIDLLNFKEESKFLGYDQTNCIGKVIGLFKNGVSVDVLDDEGDVIFDQTCFYAESGGQIADTGRIFASGVELNVTDVKKAVNKQHLHHVKVVKGSVKVNDVLQLQIDEQRRYKIMLNHSSVHLLHAALRKIVGTHITQAGSYVSDEYARFDFTNFEKISDETLREIEHLVNEYIAQAIDVKTEVMSLQEAKNTGAIALFDEKYGDLVRVVFMADTSIEFCGGTHVKNTSQLGVFKIEFEESIGSGIRRIQTKTSMNAYHDFVGYKQQLEYLSGLFKLTNINALNEKVEHLLDENTKIKKELQLLKEKQSILQANEYIQNAKEIHGIKVLLLTLDGYQGNLKGFAEILRNKLVKSFVFVVSVEDEKLTYVACSSKDAIKKNMKANEVIKFVNELVSGKGGGKPDVAQGGCADSTKVDVLIKEVETKLQSL